MEGLGINPWILLAQIVNFVFLVVILRAVGYKPIMKMLRERQERIQKSIEDARVADEARAVVEAQRDEMLAQARTEAERVVAEASRKGREEVGKLLAQAREEVERIRATARQDAELEWAQVLGEMRGQIAALAIAAAQKIIGEMLDEQRQRRLIDEFFSGIRAGRVVVLDEEELEWAKRAGAMTAHVTTALPLSPGEQETVAGSLAEHLGERPELEFKVDPSILGGLVIRIGDRVIDGSVAGQLTSLQERLR
jgi:F-type H+-transporting ATPase subunit b